MSGIGLGTSVQHQVAAKITEFLINNQVIDSKVNSTISFPIECFQMVRQLVTDRFYVDQTSITPLMARTLFSIAYHHQPKRILFIGSYMGNALVWLATSGMGPLGIYQAERIVGLDVNREANRQARTNFTALFGNDHHVEILDMDAYEWIAQTEDHFDLIFLDLEEPDRGKRGYLDLLQSLQNKLMPNALILAHDICVEKFEDDLLPYLNWVQNKDHFSKTVSLKIDLAGLEVTRI